ncbi:putative phosphoprotein [Candidatus Chlamydia sanziniae]|uniref:Putative phosphoprotein n=2 Tax=Candidatus Chlamydia sanziniae TaxID=1806891 RepID=A0A1A9HV18_9CHLA|nr:putative phosphoprotein [Candidatus Chlamydia sanziniae]
MPQRQSLSHDCANAHAALVSGENCDQLFAELMNRVLSDQSAVTAYDWETVSSLVRQYLQTCIRQGNHEKGIHLLNQLLPLPLPSIIKNELRVFWYRFNPNKAPLRKIVEHLHCLGCNESLHDQLLFELYKMTLYSSYEERKQEILLAKERGHYVEALNCASQLLQALDEGMCSPHTDVVNIEQCFLKKTICALQIAKARDLSQPYESLLVPYCLAEAAYAEAIETLVKKIAIGQVSRAQEVDAVLLEHALHKLSSARHEAIQELEVLIDYGEYVQSPLLYYGYFSLLELYHQDKHFPATARLLAKGEQIFTSQHLYFPEYGFFLGAYYYAQGEYVRAKEIFLGILEPATRLGKTFAKIYEYLGCIACLEENYHEAENFFLRAYKSWGREEANMGLFLAYTVQKKQASCEAMLYQMHFSFKNRQLLNTLYLLSFHIEERAGTYAVGLGNVLKKHSPPLVSELYSYCIYDMIKDRKIMYSNMITELIYSHIHKLEENALIKAKEEIQDPKYQQVLAFWKACKGDLPPIHGSYEYDEEKMATCCYEALYAKKAEAISALPLAFSEECSSLQSALRLVWALTRPKNPRVHNFLYCDRLPLRPCGDRLYLLTYDLEDYLEGNEDALMYLSVFPDLFPQSSLLSLVYYLQGYSEFSPLRKAGWFIKALAEFSDISMVGENAKAWAYIYYTLKLDLADTYFILGNISRAVEILEEVKEDWYVDNHPYVLLLKDEPCYLTMELRWVEGLAQGYTLLNETDYLIQHLLEHVEKNLLYARSRREYYGRGLAATVALCQRFLPN